MANTRKRSSRKTANSEEPQEAPREETQEELDAAGEARRAKVMATPEVTVEPYAPKRSELKSANFDHEGAEAKREAERAAQREEHNRRVGDASR
jgi:hypothetical protein